MDTSDPAVDVEGLQSDLLLSAGSEECSSTQRQVVTWMRWMLAGPDWRCCGRGRSARSAMISARIWASSCAVFGFSIGYLARAKQEFDFRDNRVPVCWNVLGYILQGLAFVTGVVMMEVTVTMAQKLSHSGAVKGTETGHIDDAISSSYGSNADISSRDFLGTILTSGISDEAQRSVKRQVFSSMSTMVLMFTFYVWYGALFLNRSLQYSADDGYDSVEETLKLLAMICAPMTIIVMAGWGIFINVPRIIVADHVKRAAESVRVINFEPTKSDHLDEVNAMFAEVVNSHEEMVRLSSLLAPAITVTFYMPVSFALFFVAMGLVPRGEGSEADWIDDKYPRVWFIFEAMSMWLITTAPFALLSTSTDACDQLLDALTANINVRYPSDSGCAGSSLASPRDLIRIEGVRDYFKGLNRNQGVGFMWRGVRVSTQLVRKVSLIGFAVLLIWMWISYILGR